jgi:hypothetical protein
MAITRPSLLLAALFALMPCAAFAQQPICPGTRAELDTSLSLLPFVRMRLGNREGNFLIDTAANRNFVDAQTFGLSPGEKVRINGSSLPTLSAADFLAHDNRPVTAPGGGRAAGVIGTDFVSLRSVEFHYDSAQPHMVISSQPCPTLQLERAGFIPISQKGYYSSDQRRLQPQHFNIPVAFVRIGSVSAPVWIDSGYSEQGPRPGVIQINALLFQRLRDSGVLLQQAGSVSTGDCNGNIANETLWQVRGMPLSLTTREGKPVFGDEAPLLQVRGPNTCGGGIGGLNEPWGLIGAVYLKWWNTVVFDGPNEKVWVKKVAVPERPEPMVATPAQPASPEPPKPIVAIAALPPPDLKKLLAPPDLPKPVIAKTAQPAADLRSLIKQWGRTIAP